MKRCKTNDEIEAVAERRRSEPEDGDDHWMNEVYVKEMEVYLKEMKVVNQLTAIGAVSVLAILAVWLIRIAS